MMQTAKPPLSTWANAFTLLRLLVAVPCMLAIIYQLYSLSTVLFFIAAVSDQLDGKLARLLQQATKFGSLFDHATDALFVTLCLGAFAYLGEITWLLPILVPAAFLQYLLDSDYLAGQALRTSQLGKYNGVLYFVLVGFLICRAFLTHVLPLPTTLQLGLATIFSPLLPIAAWLLCASTSVSMLDRLLTFRRLKS